MIIRVTEGFIWREEHSDIGILTLATCFCPCLHDKSLHGGEPVGGRAGGSRTVALGCAESLKSWVLSANVDQRAPTRLKERLGWGQNGLCLSQKDFSCAPKGRVGVTHPGKPLH